MAARSVKVRSTMRWVIMAVFFVAAALWIKIGYVAAQGSPKGQQAAPPLTKVRTAADVDKTPSERESLVINVTPVRTIADPNPVFRAVVIDAEHGEVFIANDKESAGTSILVYPTDFQPTDRIMEPKRRIAGPKSDIGMVCGLAISPQHGELYTISGETGTVNVYPMDANGNVGPARQLKGIIPRSGAGVFLDAPHDELFITTQHANRINVYRREFTENEEPLRYIQGPDTGLADPHGIFVDSTTGEIFVSNHGNYHAVVPGEGERRGPDSLTRTDLGYGEPGRVYPLAPSTGKFLLPSISVHSRTASGNAGPIRVIQGPHTQLTLPDGMFRDSESGEIIVANTGGDSILFFPKDANGDVAPDRVLKGPATKIKGPAGVSIDSKRHELWVASWDNHVAGVFPLNASGNMAPLRVVRTSSDDAPLASMGRIGQVAYDPKRKEVLAPNWVSQPRISAYASSADGNAIPTRVIEGPNTHQARTSHYLAVDPVHDELIVPNPFADALLVFKGGAKGDVTPTRIIQGPKTLLVAPDNVAVDPIHKELFNASFPTDSIFVYQSEANGDVAPVRIIHGPHTQLDRPIRVEADGVNNIIAVLTDHALLIFNRTDNGDVAPRWVLSGDKVGVGSRFGTRAVRLYAKGKKIIAGGGTPRLGAQAAARGGQVGAGDDEEGYAFGRNMDRFLGVWKYGDSGNVAPLIKVHGPGGAAAIIPEDGDVVSGGAGVIHFYHVPQIFQ